MISSDNNAVSQASIPIATSYKTSSRAWLQRAASVADNQTIPTNPNLQSVESVQAYYQQTITTQENEIVKKGGVKSNPVLNQRANSVAQIQSDYQHVEGLASNMKHSRQAFISHRNSARPQTRQEAGPYDSIPRDSKSTRATLYPDARLVHSNQQSAATLNGNMAFSLVNNRRNENNTMRNFHSELGKPKISTLSQMRNSDLDKAFKQQLQKDAEELWKSKHEIKASLHPNLSSEMPD